MTRTTLLIRAIFLIPALFSLQARCASILGLTSAALVGPSPVNLTNTRVVIYQTSDGALYVRTHVGPWRAPQRIPITIPPRSKTPLAACVWVDRTGKETVGLL